MFQDNINIIGSQCGTHSIFEVEKKFNKYFQKEMNSIGMCNATMAIMSVLIALDLKPGDKIVTTPYTWGGTISGALFMGLNIVFADIDPLTLTLSPEAVESKIQLHKDIKLILDVDIHGNPSRSYEINKLANKYNCFHLIDSASGFGAFYKGKPTGFYSDAVIHSFSESKNINVGEGAILAIRDENLFEKVVYQTQHPYRAKRDAPSYLLNQFALNFRMHPYSAHLLQSQFEQAIIDIEKKRKKILNFFENFKSFSGEDILYISLKEYLPSFNRICIKVNENIIKNLVSYQEAQEFEIIPSTIEKLLFQDLEIINQGFEKQVINSVMCNTALEIIHTSVEIKLK